jgi:hypothetical protein
MRCIQVQSPLRTLALLPSVNCITRSACPEKQSKCISAYGVKGVLELSLKKAYIFFLNRSMHVTFHFHFLLGIVDLRFLLLLWVAYHVQVFLSAERIKSKKKKISF